MNVAIKLTNIDAEIARLIITKAHPSRVDDLLLRLAFMSGFDENTPEGTFGDLIISHDVSIVGWDNRIAIEKDDPNCVIVTLEPIDDPSEEN